MSERKLKKGDHVCSYGDETTTGIVQYFNKDEDVWVVRIDSNGYFAEWSPDEPQLIIKSNFLTN